MRARVLALVVWAGLAASTAAIPNAPQSPSAMVVPLRDAPFTQLVDNGSSVAFDFAGTGHHSVRGWLTPDAAWLVWDPEWCGRVRAGPDMMGQRTWSVVWRDGFEALRALDDSRDGELTGAELGGLALWRDTNPEDTMRFYALRLHEVGMIKSNPERLIERASDWRFLSEIRKEMKA